MHGATTVPSFGFTWDDCRSERVSKAYPILTIYSRDDKYYTFSTTPEGVDIRTYFVFKPSNLTSLFTPIKSRVRYLLHRSGRMSEYVSELDCSAGMKIGNGRWTDPNSNASYW